MNSVRLILNTVKHIDPNVLDLNNVQLTEILLFSKENHDNMNNASILDATIIYLIGTKTLMHSIFDALQMSQVQHWYYF